MSFTAAQLISDSWYLSGIVAQDLEVVSGAQETLGLSLLNSVLAIKTANNRLIPYYDQLDIVAIPGQETYFIPGCIRIETFTYFIGPVRFSVIETSRRVYNGSPRVENINSLPFIWTQIRTLGGTNLKMYFSPGQNYPIQIWGKFGLVNVSLNQDLELTFDDYYIEYLRYALAEYMCSEYNVAVPPLTMKRLAEYEEMITDISPMDLSMKKMSSFNKSTAINWAYINIPGWVP